MPDEHGVRQQVPGEPEQGLIQGSILGTNLTKIKPLGMNNWVNMNFFGLPGPSGPSQEGKDFKE